jgi:hypothetical protein
MKLVEKRRAGRRLIRRHGQPQTTDPRLGASGELNAQTRRQLRDQFASLDPFAWAQELHPRRKPIRN